MSQKTPSSVEKLVLSTSPEVMENQRRALREQAPHLNGNMSFLSLMSLVAQEQEATQASNLLQISQTVPESVASNDKDTQKKTEKRKPVSEEMTRPETAPTVNEPNAPDGMDVWVLDATELEASDLTFIQNVSQASPMPVVLVNNLSPSLLEQLPQTHYKSLTVSQGLQAMLDKAYKTQKPVRIDLSETASVILRIGRDGRVSAEFMAAEQGADLFFRQNLQDLKNRLESKQLPYGELTVRQWKGQDDSPRKKQQQ